MSSGMNRSRVGRFMGLTFLRSELLPILLSLRMNEASLRKERGLPKNHLLLLLTPIKRERRRPECKRLQPLLFLLPLVMFSPCLSLLVLLLE